MKIMYTAGPMRECAVMSGIEQRIYTWSENIAVARAAANLATSQGWFVVSPHILSGDDQDEEYSSHEEYLARDLEFIRTVRPAILRLPRWSLSVGAKVELKLARELGLPLYEYDECAKHIRIIAPATSATQRLWTQDRVDEYSNYISVRKYLKSILPTEFTYTMIFLQCNEDQQYQVGLTITKKVELPSHTLTLSGIVVGITYREDFYDLDSIYCDKLMTISGGPFIGEVVLAESYLSEVLTRVMEDGKLMSPL